MGNGALAIGPKLPRSSSTLPFAPCRAVARHVREQCYIPRPEAGAGLGEDDPELPKLLSDHIRLSRRHSALRAADLEQKCCCALFGVTTFPFSSERKTTDSQ
jgi:hypothetical protein